MNTPSYSTATTVCPYCNKPVEYFYIKDRGILRSSTYDLIADTIFHSSCWNEMVEKYPPNGASEQ